MLKSTLDHRRPAPAEAQSMKNKDIVFRDSISLKGPSIWTYPPCIETWIDIGELEDYPSDKIPGLPMNAWRPGSPA